MKVKPSRPGLKVIDPTHNRAIPADGQEIGDIDTLPADLKVYWFRALRDGDVIEVKEEPKPQAEPAQQAKPQVSKPISGGASK